MALDQAEKRFGDGGAEASQENFNRLRADLTLLRELDRIDNFSWTAVNVSDYPELGSPGAVVDGGVSAIRNHPRRTPPASAASRLMESAIREWALAVLDPVAGGRSFARCGGDPGSSRRRRVP